jgi:dihydroneopterin aldolase
VADQVSLTGLAVRGRHGVFPEERRDGQIFVVDVVLDVDTRPAAEADDLARTVDYSILAADIVAIVGGEPVDLIETLAARIADKCLTDPLVQAARITVHKPNAPMAIDFADVAVTIDRSRS